MTTHDGESERSVKCVRCSRRIASHDDAVLTPEGDQVHSWCERVLASETLIRDARTKLRKSRSALDRAFARLARAQLASSSSPVAIPDDVALSVIQADPICSTCFALHCDTSLEAGEMTLGTLAVAGEITVNEGECYFCQRQMTVAKASAPKAGRSGG